MVEHSASITVKAPIDQVYQLFTHFHDFPKFMSFVKEVTYYDDQRSHWVVQALREYEWDAVNEDWIPNQQVGWRSIRGLRNSGKVKFRSLGHDRTGVDVYIQYVPPSGPLGQLGERFGVNSYLDLILQKELSNFARMVEEAPSGALDPMSSHYLFHSESATARKLVTERQRVAMEHDPMMSPQALAERRQRIEREIAQRQLQAEEQEARRRQQLELEQRLKREQTQILAREAEKRQQERTTAHLIVPQPATPVNPRHTYAVWARGLGDKDGRRPRIPNHTRDPMTSRWPSKPVISAPPVE